MTDRQKVNMSQVSNHCEINNDFGIIVRECAKKSCGMGTIF